MLKIGWTTLLVILSISAGYAQEYPTEIPLGDVARKQPAPEKKARHVLEGEGSVEEASPQVQPPDAAGQGEDSAGRSPVLDSPEDTTPDAFVVPAGTEIRVSIPDSKVVVPVRVGFATPIPALSFVSIESSLDCEDFPSFGGYSHEHCTRTYWLSAVTIDGKTYEIDTDSKIAVMQEVTFLLSRPLSIPR